MTINADTGSVETSAIATTPSRLTGGVALTSKNGRSLGDRYFMGKLSASQLKEAGKKLKLKGSALTEYVNDALRDETASRQAAGMIAVAMAAELGMAPDVFDVKNKSAALKFVKVAKADAPVSLAQQLVDAGKFATIEEAEAFLA